MTRLPIRLLVLCLASVWSVPSHADGAYGRIYGDVALQLDAGTGVDDGHPPFVGQVTVRYLQTAGAYATWVWHPQHTSGRASTAAVGIELRPLFLPRFLENKQSGPPVFDLLIDSLSLRLGAVTARRGPFSRPSPGFEAGLALGIPFTSNAEGPWLGTSGSLRWPHHAIGGIDDPSLLWTITFGWQAFFQSGLVDAADGRPP